MCHVITCFSCLVRVAKNVTVTMNRKQNTELWIITYKLHQLQCVHMLGEDLRVASQHVFITCQQDFYHDAISGQ